MPVCGSDVVVLSSFLLCGTHTGRFQAETPLIPMFRFPEPALWRSDEHWHGLAVWLSHSGMDRDAELLDRLAARAARVERQERFRAKARASRRRVPDT